MAVFSIPYTGKKYIYFRYFSAPSLDSIPIVCYKPPLYSRECWKESVLEENVGKVYEGRSLQDAVFHPSQSYPASHKAS